MLWIQEFVLFTVQYNVGVCDPRILPTHVTRQAINSVNEKSRQQLQNNLLWLLQNNNVKNNFAGNNICGFISQNLYNPFFQKNPKKPLTTKHHQNFQQNSPPKLISDQLLGYSKTKKFNLQNFQILPQLYSIWDATPVYFSNTR